LALDLIKKNNVELQKGIERATTTTVSALRTAVIVAQAISEQRLVLDQIQSLNTTTGNLIAGNAKLLQENSARVYEQASNATIDVEKLKSAFASVMQAMDDVSNFKVKALDSMEKTVTSLTGEVNKAKAYVDSERSRLTATAPTALPPQTTPEGLARIV
jgi:uncharacterized protein YaaN involved in tellurite resistance